MRVGVAVQILPFTSADQCRSATGKVFYKRGIRMKSQNAIGVHLLLHLLEANGTESGGAKT